MSIPPTVPLHVSDMPKPQDTYDIRPYNSDKIPDHVELPRELTMYSPSDFVGRFVSRDNQTIIVLVPLESTTFTYIDSLDWLDVLWSKLCLVDEFAVDLEANSYRSFQGITCLMQILTRNEDFLVDTLKLYHSIGHYLGRYFLDPTKRKVMHGAGNDILWLQRDFDIHVCNLFDTMQASRVLKLDRNSPQHLLMYFCGVLANRHYQTSDWRVCPLPRDMLHYAREDTHYLLYIYDKMRSRLVFGSGIYDFDDPLLEVYTRSYEICKVMYEKPMFTEDSYKNLFGLDDAGLNSNQIELVAKLFKWRDELAREKEENTGYIMLNKLLLEIDQKMPKSKSELLSIFDAHHHKNHPYLVQNISELLKIIGIFDVSPDVSQVDNSTRRPNKRPRPKIVHCIPQIKRPYGYL